MQRMEVLLGGAAAALVGGVLIYALSTAHPDSGVGIDDANITFVYARNIAQGHGFVFNVGGERVEGSTSLLWTLLCALVYKLGGAEAEVRWLGIACFAATQATFACLLASLPRGPDPLRVENAAPGGPSRGDGEALDFLLYFALVFSNPGYLVWNTLTLMDVTLWGATVAFAAWFVAHPPRSAVGFALAAAAWGAMCLTRPDALLVAPAFAALAGWNAGRSGLRQGLVTAGVLLAAAFVALGGSTLFRLWYFGYPLPNTYYAKVAPGVWGNFRTGLDYDLGWIVSSPIKAAATAIALIAVQRAASAAFAALRRNSGGDAGDPPRSELAPSEPERFADGLRSVQSLSAAFLVLLAVPCVTGGDHFHEHRFLQPAYPLGCLLLAAWARRERVLAKLEVLLRSSGAAAAGGVVLAAALLVPPFLHERNWWTYRGGGPLKGDFLFAKEGRVRAAGIAAMFAPPATAAAGSTQAKLPSMGLFAAGGTGYAYPGEKIDLLGLNSVAMGHSKSDRLGVTKNHSAFDAEVFYQLRPEMIDCTESILVEADFFTRGLLRTPRFHEEYVYGKLGRLDPPGGAATLFIRRELLKKLLADGAANGWGVRFEFHPIDLALDTR